MAAKERVKTIAAKSVEAFQQTNKYNTVLFRWYYKGFKLLRRYLVEHPTRVNLESLDLEVVDKEMVEDEVAQATQVATPNTVGDVPKPIDADGDEANA